MKVVANAQTTSRGGLTSSGVPLLSMNVQLLQVQYFTQHCGGQCTDYQLVANGGQSGGKSADYQPQWPYSSGVELLSMKVQNWNLCSVSQKTKKQPSQPT